MLGSCSRKLKFGNRVYVCPDKVDHYIERHGYCPPDEVIKAITEGVDSDEHATFIKNREAKERKWLQEIRGVHS